MMEDFKVDLDALQHYGTKYHSGRYPYGSGEDPYQHDGGIRGYVKDLKEKGLSEKDIAQGMGMPINEMKLRMSVEKMEQRNISYQKVLELTNKGLNNSEIGRELGIRESSVRSLKNEAINYNNNIALKTAEMLKDEVDKHGTTLVGKGTENRLNITSNKLDTALILLERQGYTTYNIPVKQLGTEKTTTAKCLVPPGQTWGDTAKAVTKGGNIHVINDTYSEDGGRTWERIEPPRSISSKRVLVRTAEEGGKDKDGLIEIRPGVEDLDMGRNQYAQVRIAVDDKYYMKGMAIYNPNLPDGVDIVYNSNKSKAAGPEKWFKPLKDDPNNPFGSTIKDNEYDDDGNLIREVGQRHYIDKNGKKQLSAINIVNEQGDWGNWKKRLAAQMLSKQDPKLAKKQLDLAYNKQEREYQEIMALTNPVIKKKLLQSFADDCESKAVHLKAAALPGQASHVIIPFPEIKDNEIYAPNYKNGTVVSLIRYPHEGIFQIPTLVVNNRNKEAKKLLGNARDAVGINAKVAEHLSGADFDGDSVLVIPNPNGKMIKHKPMLADLEGFETSQYSREAFPPEQRTWKPPKEDKAFNEQREMGKISNLIMDMTLKGADEHELARATKHSMVVIDSEKHDLNWRQSYKDNKIQELKEKYQDGGGVSTLITRAKSRDYVPQRADFYENMIDPKTGEINWREKMKKTVDPITGETKYSYPTKRIKNKKTGEYEDSDIRKTTEVTKMEKAFSEGKSAHTLSSGTIIEEVYADYADDMHKLACKARLSLINTPNMVYNKSANKEYAEEVKSINDKLNEALKSHPLELKAQAIAGARLKIWKEENPDADFQDIKKHSGLMLSEARKRMGSAKHRIKLTPKEWEAVQAGAITNNKFREVLNNTDTDLIKQYATPRDFTPKLTKSEISYAKSLLENDKYTSAEVAELLGVSTSTLYKALE